MSTFIVSTLFSKYEQLNKKQTYEAISLGLTDRQDVIAENEFNKISSAIKSDAQLKNFSLISSIHHKIRYKKYAFGAVSMIKVAKSRRIYQLIL